MMPHFFIFFPRKNTVNVVAKTKKRPKTRFLKLFKILDCLNEYLSNMRPSNYLILEKGALNFHLKSNSSFYHFYSWFYALFVKKTLCDLAEESLFKNN